jgi:hypothetical protein
MWPIKSSQGRPGHDRRDESGRRVEAGFTEASLRVLADNHPSTAVRQIARMVPGRNGQAVELRRRGSVMEVRYVKPLTSLPG